MPVEYSSQTYSEFVVSSLAFLLRYIHFAHTLFKIVQRLNKVKMSTEAFNLYSIRVGSHGIGLS